MNIASSPSVQSATTAVQGKNADAVHIAVLRKALNTQAASAIGLLQAIPQPPLASSGSLGTRVNTLA